VSDPAQSKQKTFPSGSAITIQPQPPEGTENVIFPGAFPRIGYSHLLISRIHVGCR